MLVPLKRAGDTWENSRGRYILLTRDGITLKIFRDRYVLLPRAGNTLNIFGGSTITCRVRKNSGWLYPRRQSEKRLEQRSHLSCHHHSRWLNQSRPSEQSSEQPPQLSYPPPQ